MKEIIKAIREIDWAKLDSAYGDSHKILIWLETLFISKDVDKCLEACGELHANLIHQESVYSSTEKAIPFLISSLKYCPNECRVSIVNLLSYIADSCSYFLESEIVWEKHQQSKGNPFKTEQEVIEDLEPYYKPFSAALWAGFADFVSLLNDNEKGIRIKTPHLLASLLSFPSEWRNEPSKKIDFDREVSGKMLNLFSAEKDSFVLCSYVFALSSFGFRRKENVVMLKNILRETIGERVKICAAMCLIDHNECEKSVEVVAETLLNNEETGKMFNNELPWFMGHLRFHLVKRLCSLPTSMTNQVLPALLISVDCSSQHTVQGEIDNILHFVFGDGRLDLEKSSADLTDFKELF